MLVYEFHTACESLSSLNTHQTCISIQSVEELLINVFNFRKREKGVFITLSVIAPLQYKIPFNYIMAKLFF